MGAGAQALLPAVLPRSLLAWPGHGGLPQGYPRDWTCTGLAHSLIQMPPQRWSCNDDCWTWQDCVSGGGFHGVSVGDAREQVSEQPSFLYLLLHRKNENETRTLIKYVATVGV